MAEVRIQTWQAYVGGGGNFPRKGNASNLPDQVAELVGSDAREPTARFGLTGGVTLEFAEQFKSSEEQRFGMPINAFIERVAPGIWSYGGEVLGRVNSKKRFVTLDLGTKLSALNGKNETGLEVTPLGRVGLFGNITNLEAGVVAHSGHSQVLAGDFHFLVNLNVPAAIAAIAWASTN